MNLKDIIDVCLQEVYIQLLRVHIQALGIFDNDDQYTAIWQSFILQFWKFENNFLEMNFFVLSIICEHLIANTQD